MINTSAPKLNQRPIIGVVAQEFDEPTPERQSYISASYVKYLEAAGARVVPIFINQTEEEYRALFMSINGLLFPGGRAGFFKSVYGKVTTLLFQLAREANDRGDFFPVWGTCLGFQIMSRLSVPEKVLLNRICVYEEALPLDFTAEAKESRMLKDFPADLLHALATEPLTINLHKWSLNIKTHEKIESLNKFYRVLSTNTHQDNTFVSTMEAYNYPFYGVQWHPEMNQFDFGPPYIPHTPSAIRAAYYFADFFVNEARKNGHHFNSEEEERKALIHNWNPVTIKLWSNWRHIYFF